MAKYTNQLIFDTFENMLAEKSFDKITVSALVKRCGISANTFYYHYNDIYDLLNRWMGYNVERIKSEIGDTQDWKQSAGGILRYCKNNPKITYHVSSSISRERLERYIFSRTNDVFVHHITIRTESKKLSDEQINEISKFCRYAFVGFFLNFIWERMKADIDSSIAQLEQLFNNFVDASAEAYKAENNDF